MATITKLSTQYPPDMIGVDRDPIRLTWQIAGPPRSVQRRAEIQASRSADFAGSYMQRTIDGRDQVAVVAPGGHPVSREIRYYRVRADVDGSWTDWSETCSVEFGLLSSSDWTAAAITRTQDPGRFAKGPSPILRAEFEQSAQVASARMYVTSLGVNRIFINGSAVSGDLLAPGWSTYSRRLVAYTYDVTSMIRTGTNAIAGVLGDGWFRGRLGWSPGEDRCNYGDTLGLVVQLEITDVEGRTRTMVSDSTWKTSTGAIRSADIYDGCEIDLREEPTGWKHAGFDDAEWSAAAVTDLAFAVVEPWISAPIRHVRTLDVGLTSRPDGSIRVDVGQNISGYLAIEARGARGATVTTRHAEVLEPDGSLHLLALRSAKASDHFVLADERPVTLIPEFTFHGFQYADIFTDAEVLKVTAHAISSDLPERSTFSCSHSGLEQLVSNVRWSQRDNFVGVPSDCPQRDERLGWTGDAQAFAATADVLFDSHQFWLNWMRDMTLDQTDEGVPSVVPNVVLDGEPSVGRAGWADAAAIVPWASFESYGSIATLEQQLGSMIRWVETLRAKRHDDGLLGGEFQFGDWLDPDAPSSEPWKAKADGDFIANAFFAHSAKLTAKAAELLGRHDVAETAAELSEDVATLTWARWGQHAMSTQTGCAVAIELEIAPPERRAEVAAALADLVDEADGAVSTGFLGTPLVMPALSRHGHLRAAYSMLLRTDVRSWLYQVEHGATTVWERWDAIRPDGTIHDGRLEAPANPGDAPDEPHMLSFNHYAYGAVVDWIYRNVGGVAPDITHPGYVHVLLAPRPCTEVTAASTTIETGLGSISFDWHVVDDVFQASVSLPFGCMGTFTAPATSESEVTWDGKTAPSEVHLSHGSHVLTVTTPAVVRLGEAG